MVTCPRCGAQNPDGATFCAKCGAQIAAATPTPVAATAPATAVPAVIGDPKKNGQAVAALVLGIVGLVMSVIWFIAIPINVVGLIMGVMGMKSQKRGMGTAGLVLSIVGLVASIGMMIAFFVGISILSDIGY